MGKHVQIAMGNVGDLEYAMEGEDGEKGAMNSDSKVYTW
jgi:hypothetical protein